MKHFSCLFIIFLMVGIQIHAQKPPTKIDTLLSEIRLPDFKESILDSFNYDKRNRYLIIDANSNIKYRQNNILLKRKGSDSVSPGLKRANAVNKKGSISLLLKNYSFGEGETFKVSLQSSSYTYKSDLSDLYGQKSDEEVVEGGDTPDLKNLIQKGTQAPGDTITEAEVKAKIEKHLEGEWEKLKSVISLNIKEQYAVNDFIKQLKQLYAKNESFFNEESTKIYNELITWEADYVALTPISVAVDDGDELAIALTFSENGNPKTVKVGNYRIIGGIGIRVATQFYISGLKNNEYYTVEEYLVTEDSTAQKQRFAKLDETDNLTLGLGMNGEVFFRTGSALQPTINLGFYIPIGQEDIKPYLAIGPGFSLGSNNVKLSFNGGLTLGQEIVIKDRYKNVDLNTIEGYTDANATAQVWKNSWYFGFGISYNLSK